MNTLKQAGIGDTVKVVKLHGEGAVKRRIMDMGITRGVEMRIRKVAPTVGGTSRPSSSSGGTGRDTVCAPLRSMSLALRARCALRLATSLRCGWCRAGGATTAPTASA